MKHLQAIIYNHRRVRGSEGGTSLQNRTAGRDDEGLYYHRRQSRCRHHPEKTTSRI